MRKHEEAAYVSQIEFRGLVAPEPDVGEPVSCLAHAKGAAFEGGI